jgi:hypothetical protein
MFALLVTICAKEGKLQNKNRLLGIMGSHNDQLFEE